MASPMEFTDQSVPYKLIGARLPGITYIERTSVRCIVYDKTSQKIALIHVANGNYHKLPGGGLEPSLSETHKQALQRELLEEIGCTISESTLVLIGRSEEFRQGYPGQYQHQISFCYAADLAEDTGRVHLTEEETQDGFVHFWADVDAALQLMDGDNTNNDSKSEFVKFVIERDRFFVKVYRDRFGVGAPQGEPKVSSVGT